MNELVLFAGACGGILGGKLLGWRTICAVEIDAYCAGILVARQNDGLLPPFPIWDDVRTFDGNPWRGIIDVVSGGFPCQDISCAGKGDGLDGERSGLWTEFARIIGEVRPRYAFIENSPMLTLRGGDRVLSDLASMGYDARWGVVSAADAGAPHRRERIWILAHANSVVGGWEDTGREARQGSGEHHAGEMADADRAGFGERLRTKSTGQEQSAAERSGESLAHANGESMGRVAKSWSQCRLWESEPDVGRVANGVAFRLDRLKALGNGQVPACAALAWRLLGGP